MLTFKSTKTGLFVLLKPIFKVKSTKTNRFCAFNFLLGVYLPTVTEHYGNNTEA